MKSLADLIARHPVPGVRQSLERGMLAEALTEFIGVAVTAKQFRLESSTLTLSVPPVLKSALLMRQAELLPFLNARSIKVSTVR